MSLQSIFWPVQVGIREHRLSVRWRDEGDELVLFVHGLGCSKDSWAEAWQQPELRGYSLLAPDLPGFGFSDSPEGYTHDLSEYASIIHALIDNHASRRIHLVAHSMGGAVVLLLPPRVLSRLASLVLVEGRMFSSSCGLAAETRGLSAEEFSANVFPRIYGRKSGYRTATYDLDRADPLALYGAAQSLLSWTKKTDLFVKFTEADCPKYFFYGDMNQHLEELRQLDPEVCVMIEDAAHFPMNEAPTAFYARLRQLMGAQS